MPVFDDAARAADDLIRRLDGSRQPPWRNMVAERLAEASRDPAHALLAKHVLRHTDTSPQDWGRVNDFLKDNRLSLGDTIGSGEERLVFEAIPDSGDQRYVFKIGYDPRLYDVPDIPGVVPYVQKGAEGGVSFGVQPRARMVYGDQWRPAGHGHWEWWSDRARDVEQSLWQRGYHWQDPGEGNIGIMPSGMFGVIDGQVLPRTGFVPQQGGMPTDEAIRRLSSGRWFAD